MEWGGGQDFFKALKLKGKKVGGNASGGPPIDPRLLQYWRAFSDLHRRRQWQQGGPQPLAYTEMEAYIRLKFRLKKPPQVRRLLRFVEDLDDAFLNNFSEKQERKAKA